MLKCSPSIYPQYRPEQYIIPFPSGIDNQQTSSVRDFNLAITTYCQIAMKLYIKKADRHDPAKLMILKLKGTVSKPIVLLKPTPMVKHSP